MSVPDPVPFDSHQFVKRMTEAGMPLAQAEALAEEQGVMVNTHFATKQDTGELKHRFANVEHDVGGLKQDTGEIKTRLANVEHDVGGLKQDTGEIKTRLANVEHDVGELKQDTGELKTRLANVEHDVGGLKQDTGELKVGLAVVKAELALVKWMVSGVGFGMLLLLVRTFWPT